MEQSGTIRRLSRVAAAAAGLAALSALPVAAIDLTVTHYGTSMYGVPYTVAKERGLFKEVGLDVTGFITSAGGGTTVRNALASDIPYGEVATSAAIAAIKQGLPITIVNSGVNTVGDILWIARKDDNRIREAKDLEGKSIGYSSPKGGADMVLSTILVTAGVKADKKAVGGAGSSLTALREGAVDMTWTQEPIWSREKNNYRLVFNSADFIPKVSQTVGIVRTDFLQKSPDLIRSIIEARRRGVEALYKDPVAAGEMIAKEYKLEPDVAREAVKNVLVVKGVEYWSRGAIDYEGLETSLKQMQLVGAVDDKPLDWSKVVSEAALPDDLRKKLSQ